MAVVTFGKYKGKDLNEVPTDYVKWYIRVQSPTLAEFQEELARRETPPTPTTPEQTGNVVVLSESQLDALVCNSIKEGYNRFLRYTNIEMHNFLDDKKFTKQEILDLMRFASRPLLQELYAAKNSK
ncbi:MAG: DUF3820 family protein [Methanotrichaceae archaeon]|nr:DUF3820 family protein [Methanotrichaceae archaeon]